jgi:hypothetical protein
MSHGTGLCRSPSVSLSKPQLYRPQTPLPHPLGHSSAAHLPFQAPSPHPVVQYSQRPRAEV